MPEKTHINRIPTPQEIELTAEGSAIAARARAAMQAGSGVKGAAKAAQAAKAFSRVLMPVGIAADVAQTAYDGFDKSADDLIGRVTENPARGWEANINPTAAVYATGRAAVSQAEQLAAPAVDEQRKRMQEQAAKLRRFAATTRTQSPLPPPKQYSVLPIQRRPSAMDPYASTSQTQP